MASRNSTAVISSDNSNIREVKVVMVGETAVGKSCSTLKFVNGNFKENSVATIGASYLSKALTIDNMVIKFNIWDTAGQEKYRSLASLYYRGADCAIIVYDITNRVQNYWIPEIQHQCHGNTSGLQVCIAGNKSDLVDQREVSAEEGRELAEKSGAIFFETSAKLDDNITEIFKLFGNKIIKSDSVHGNDNGKVDLKVRVADRKKKGCC